MSRELLQQALKALKDNRRSHYYCEDEWYSCPKHEDGCANESEGDECNCGADEANIQIDAAITALRQAIAQAEKQEPTLFYGRAVYFADPQTGEVKPPRKEWVGLTDKDILDLWVANHKNTGATDAFARAIETMLKQKNI